jgi:hypothetical protein
MVMVMVQPARSFHSIGWSHVWKRGGFKTRINIAPCLPRQLSLTNRRLNPDLPSAVSIFPPVFLKPAPTSTVPWEEDSSHRFKLVWPAALSMFSPEHRGRPILLWESSPRPTCWTGCRVRFDICDDSAIWPLVEKAEIKIAARLSSPKRDQPPRQICWPKCRAKWDIYDDSAIWPLVEKAEIKIAARLSSPKRDQPPRQICWPKCRAKWDICDDSAIWPLVEKADIKI